MSVVKITNKEQLDRLLARLTLRLGMKPTQQEVLDLCVQLGDEHFETLVGRLNSFPILDDEKVERIQQIAEELRDVPWGEPTREKFASKDDADIYTV